MDSSQFHLAFGTFGHFIFSFDDRYTPLIRIRTSRHLNGSKYLEVSPGRALPLCQASSVFALQTATHLYMPALEATGQTLLWSEQTDEHNMDSIIWYDRLLRSVLNKLLTVGFPSLHRPRALSTAELYWTGTERVRSVTEALPRIHDMRYTPSHFPFMELLTHLLLAVWFQVSARPAQHQSYPASASLVRS